MIMPFKRINGIGHYMDISNIRGTHRAVTDSNECLKTAETHCRASKEAVGGRRRGFNFQRHGKPFTDRKGDGVAGKCPSPKEKIKRHSETQDGFQILLR